MNDRGAIRLTVSPNDARFRFDSSVARGRELIRSRYSRASEEEADMLSDLLHRLRALLRRSAVERELDEELQFHLEQQIQKLMQTGVAREEAARRARMNLGGM